MISPIIVIALRLVVPITIFRWPLGGALLSVALDALDVVLVDVIAGLVGEPPGFGGYYHSMDKALDVYYMSFEAIVSWRWNNCLARNTSIALFVYRVIGMALFEVTGIRKLLFIFPNLFENFYLYYVIAARFFPRFAVTSGRQLTVILVLLLIPKMAQEWLLHYQEAQPWNWFKQTFLGG